MTDFPSSNAEKPKRVSLTEVSRRAPKVLQRGDSQLLDEGAAPTLNDLAGALQFALGDGRIWLNDNRMVLMQTEVLGALEAQMIRDKGMDHARTQLMRIGWDQGVRLAELIKARFSQQNLTESLAAGPRLHTLEGYAKVITKRFEFDAARKSYLGEFHWIDSVEGTQHFNHFGVCDCPVCWMQVGVPSGYTTTLLGFPVIFREIDCVAQGAARCLVIGKDIDSWDGDVPEREIFGLAPTNRERNAPWNPAQPAVPFLPQPSKQDDMITGTSTAIQRTKRLLEKAAPFNESVLLFGEPGTGKEFFARYLHKHHNANNGPFVVVNCAALQDAQPTEHDELFGEKGFLNEAAGGTLFLNDLLSLTQGHQAKLAAHLRQRPAARSNMRIISASGQSPVEAVAEGQFRSDLFTLLAVLPIEVPSLSERRDDIPLLVAHFLKTYVQRHGKTVQGLSGAAFDVLLRYDYTGNVRELSNLIERGLIFAEAGGFIEISHMFTSLETLPEMTRHSKLHVTSSSDAAPSGQSTLETLEIELLRTTLVEAQWNVSEAARKLGLSRAKLDYRIKKFGLGKPQ